VYVDDIIFGSSSHSLVARFEMSMMGELQFFLSLQIKQSKEALVGMLSSMTLHYRH
jgi:hypothetical protein